MEEYKLVLLKENKEKLFEAYAVFSTDDSLMLKEFEFKGWLKEVICDARPS